MNRFVKGSLSAVLAVTAIFACSGSVFAQAGAAADVGSKRVTLNLENADLRYALKLLFTSAGVNYTLDQGVQGTVTVALTDVPFRTALESVLRSTQSVMPLTYRMEDNVYQISPKVENLAGPEVNPNPDEKVVTPKQNFNKIFINF